jgi:hypothetical protein
MSAVERYKKLKNVDVASTPIPAFVPRPTDDDYKFGTIDRIFLQKRGTEGYPIFEIGKETVERLSGLQQYNIVTIQWRISGPLTDLYKGGVYYPSVITTNSKGVAEAAKQMPDIVRHLINLKQFHRP